MRRGALGLAVLVVVGALVWWLLGRDEPRVVEGRAEAPKAQVAEAAKGSKAPSSSADAVDKPVTEKRRLDKAEREAVRKKILEGIREHQARPREPKPSPTPDRRDEPESERSGTGGIKDRSDGELSNLIATINDDLMPLADECYEQARETDPDLTGMLDINFQVIADEDIGGLVDAVDLGQENEIENEALVECVRETILSTIFPSPNQTGEQGVRLTLRFTPDE